MIFGLSILTLLATTYFMLGSGGIDVKKTNYYLPQLEAHINKPAKEALLRDKFGYEYNGKKINITYADMEKLKSELKNKHKPNKPNL